MTDFYRQFLTDKSWQILDQTREVEELTLNRRRFAKIRKELLTKLASRAGEMEGV